MRKPLKIQKKFRTASPKAAAFKGERLASCAIIRGGTLHHDQRSHAQIRAGLGDSDPYEQKHRPNDEEGFMTSHGRFVTRDEARIVGEKAGQVISSSRMLLSSDVRW